MASSGKKRSVSTDRRATVSSSRKSGGSKPVDEARHIWRHASPIIEPQINAEGKHSWPFSPSFPLDIGRLIFNGQGEIRMNRHDYLELLFVCSGEITFQIHDRLCHLAEGDLLVMGPTLYHRPIRQGGPPAKAVTLFFMPDVICSGGRSADEAEYLLPFYAQDCNFPHVVQKSEGIPAKIQDLIEEIENELSRGHSHSQLMAKTYLKMILAILVRHYSSWLAGKSDLDRKAQGLERLRPLFSYMDEHYQERISLQRAATLVHMSKSHFIRFFKEVTARSFSEYLNHFRIAKAQALLRGTDKPLAEVAWDVGFCDQSHFGSVFRRFVRMTPMQYRQSAGESLRRMQAAEFPFVQRESIGR